MSLKALSAIGTLNSFSTREGEDRGEGGERVGGEGFLKNEVRQEQRTHLVYISCMHREREGLSGFLCDKHWSLQHTHAFQHHRQLNIK